MKQRCSSLLGCSALGSHGWWITINIPGRMKVCQVKFSCFLLGKTKATIHWHSILGEHWKKIMMWNTLDTKENNVIRYKNARWNPFKIWGKCGQNSVFDFVHFRQPFFLKTTVAEIQIKYQWHLQYILVHYTLFHLHSWSCIYSIVKHQLWQHTMREIHGHGSEKL